MTGYVVIPREDLIHEPKFLGDQAETGVVAWEVWGDVERTAYGFSGECVDSFDTEEEACACADDMNRSAA